MRFDQIDVWIQLIGAMLMSTLPDLLVLTGNSTVADLPLTAPIPGHQNTNLESVGTKMRQDEHRQEKSDPGPAEEHRNR